MEAFLTGFSVATGVSLIVFPTTSRKVLLKQTAKYLGSLQDALKSHAKFLHS